MKKFTKPAVLLPMLAGIGIGVVMFLLGDAGDAPGLSLLGLVAGFLLIVWGVYNASLIPKGFLAPTLLLCFGAGGIVLSLALLLDGEFGESPGMALIGVALGVLLVTIGTIMLRQTIKSRTK